MKRRVWVFAIGFAGLAALVWLLAEGGDRADRMASTAAGATPPQSTEASAAASDPTRVDAPAKGSSDATAASGAARPTGTGPIVTAMLTAEAVIDHSKADALGLRDSISAAMRRFVSDGHEFPELAACAAQSGMTDPSCRRLLDQALNKALTWTVARELVRPETIARFTASLGRSGAAASAREVLERTLQGSEDPFDRVAALVLEQRVASESAAPPRALPKQVFARLSQRPAVEGRYLLRAFAQAPAQDPEVFQEVAVIALSPERSSSDRRLALRALGAAGAGAAFEAVIREAEGGASFTEQGAITAIGPGLARCGSACEKTLARLARQPSSNARLAVLVALAKVDPAELDGLARELLPVLSSASSTTALERDQLALVQQRLEPHLR